MQRILPYPLLFITAILLERVVISSTHINIDQSLRGLFILILLTLLVGLIIQYFVRDWHHTNFMVLMIPACLIGYRSSYSFLKIKFPEEADVLGLALMILFGILYAAVVRRRVWRSVRNPVKVTTYFSLVSTLLLTFQVGRLAEDGYKTVLNVNRAQEGAALTFDLELQLQQEPSPDIYVIVLDGYARQDVLQDLYKHDNTEFIDWLKQRGFYIADESHSNYTQTPYTMASFWNLDYLRSWESSSEYARYLYQPIQNNRVFQSLDKLGYTTVSSGGAVHFTEIKNSDVYLSDFLPLNNFETLLLIDSPLEPLSNLFDLGMPVQTYKTHRQRTLSQLDMLKEVPAQIPGPKIVYTHILAPHPPFVFHQNGDVREPQRPYTLAEGAAFQGGQEEYRFGYREQVKFMNEEIMKAIDAILTKSEGPPIILLMGDHGPASMFNFDLETPGCLWERTSNLYAILLPGHQNDGTLYSSISPVNTFRVIFNNYFGTDIPLLEDKSYMMDWQQPSLKVDITGKRDSRESCTRSNDY